MDFKDIPTGLGLQLNVIDSLFREFDFITSANIEEGMICDLNCCLAHEIPRYTEILMECYADAPDSSILSAVELNTLNQLTEKLSELLRYCYENGVSEKGFSKTQQWIEFVNFTNTANILLKDAVKKHTADIKKEYLNTIHNLCSTLDFLCSSNIKEESKDSLIHSIESAIDYIEFLTTYADKTQSNVDFLLPFKKALYEARSYNNEKGFSKKQQWIDFIEFVTMINIILKDILKKYKK